MTTVHANWVDPTELADWAEEVGAVDSRWCFTCGYRADRSPMVGGCGCRVPAELPNACPDCGGHDGYGDARFACYCRPPWQTP